MTKNPANGKKERVFVDLQVVYPSPEEPGTELSFEEVWAANRNWLNRSWENDEASDIAENNENSPPVVARAASSKMIITLDENGCIPEQNREGRSKKKKVMEVNETQISTWVPEAIHIPEANSQQSKQSWTRPPALRYARNTDPNPQ